MPDGLCHLSFNISETKHAMKKLATNIVITSKVLIDKTKYIARNILPFTFKSSYKMLRWLEITHYSKGNNRNVS